MTTATARTGATTNGGTTNGGTTTGAGSLLRFMLRRERFGLPWWLLGITFLWTYQSVGSQSLYDTPEKLARLRDTLGGNAALVAMSGPKELLDTIGGEVVFEIFAYAAVVVALMNMFLIGRHTRSDEDTGRAELIRSARVGRHAPLAAALGLAGLANLAVAVLVFIGMAGTGLPVAGSLIVAGAVAGVGLTFAALTAVAVQVFESPRALYGAVGAAMGAAFMLRAAGDAGDGTLSWLSPFGWGQRTFPYVENRVWPLVLPIIATVVLVAIAVALQDRRDLGAGLLPTRPGRPTASWALGSPLGLAWRLQRGALIGWSFGLLLLGVAYGSFTDAIEQYIADNPEVANFFPGGATNIVNSYLAFTMLFSGVNHHCLRCHQRPAGPGRGDLWASRTRARHPDQSWVLARQPPYCGHGWKRGRAAGRRPRRRTRIRPGHLGSEPDYPDDGCRTGLCARGVARDRAGRSRLRLAAPSGGRDRLDGAGTLLLRRNLRRPGRPACLGSQRLAIRADAGGTLGECHGDAAARDRGGGRGASCDRVRRLAPPRHRLG